MCVHRNIPVVCIFSLCFYFSHCLFLLFVFDLVVYFFSIVLITSCLFFSRLFLSVLIAHIIYSYYSYIFLFILTALTVYSQVVASGLLRRKAVVLCAEKKNFQTLSELTQCMRYSTVKSIAIIYFFILLVITSLYSSHPHLFSFLFY